jgi:hypothetical protein
MDLVIMSVASWKDFVEAEPLWFTGIPSLLVLKNNLGKDYYSALLTLTATIPFGPLLRSKVTISPLRTFVNAFDT